MAEGQKSNTEKNADRLGNLHGSLGPSLLRHLHSGGGHINDVVVYEHYIRKTG